MLVVKINCLTIVSLRLARHLCSSTPLVYLLCVMCFSLSSSFCVCVCVCVRGLATMAALRRSAQASPKLPTGPPPSHTHQLPSLTVSCIRVLVSHSNHYGMPSCASISPMLAQRLLAALKTAKKLNSKTLAAFYGW